MQYLVVWQHHYIISEVNFQYLPTYFVNFSLKSVVPIITHDSSLDDAVRFYRKLSKAKKEGVPSFFAFYICECFRSCEGEYPYVLLNTREKYLSSKKPHIEDISLIERSLSTSSVTALFIRSLVIYSFGDILK